MSKPRLYLTERNLLVLQSKLARFKASEETNCMIVKCDKAHALYPQTQPKTYVVATETLPPVASKNTLYLQTADLTKMLESLAKYSPDSTVVIGHDFGGHTVFAVQDKEYYATRSPGIMHPSDTPPLRAA